MTGYNISGIQQVGLGNASVYDTWEWYRKHLGMDLLVFDEAAEAGLMLPYTGGEPRSRHAVLALNYNGGGGMEIWQYTSRTPQPPAQPVLAGDLGINHAFFKVRDLQATHDYFKSEGIKILSDITSEGSGTAHFYASDPYGNIFNVVEGIDWYKNLSNRSGGIAGAAIGVTDIEKSVTFYKEILGYDMEVARYSGQCSDLAGQQNSGDTYERVLLTHSKPRTGAFSPLLGSTYIELIKVTSRTPRKVLEDRFWGDLGYIHLCFDIQGMDKLQATCEAAGHPFTVDSANSFDMGETAGRFSYIEDPDGTLIEFVETHKIPIMKKLGWYLDLRKRDASKALPNYFFAAMALNRKKNPVA